MRKPLLSLLSIGLTALTFAWTSPTRAEEGMWLLNQLDAVNERLMREHGMTITPEAALHMQLSAVRFPNGSGSFVSSEGLVLTNHHVALSGLAKISSGTRNIEKDGYLAKTQADEIRIPGYELNQLLTIEDVTARVNAAVTSAMNAEQANKARTAVIGQIEKENETKTGHKSQVMKLYHGGAYHLYTLKRYTDVRLVFAPEFAIGFFGGDDDNYEFPRYALDMTLFRAYEDGKPAQISNFFQWSTEAPQLGELLFVLGHPGRTNRLYTMAASEYVRETEIPKTIELNERWEKLLIEFGQRSPESKRRASSEYFSITNILKRFRGWERDYRETEWLQKKAAAETELRQYVRCEC